MSTHAGAEGIIKITDQHIAEVKSWSLEEVCDTVDASIIGSQWRKNQATIKSWSGSIDAFWDEADNGGQGKLVIGSMIELNLYPEGIGNDKKYFSGTAIITGISRQASFDGLVESSFTFQGTGFKRFQRWGNILNRYSNKLQWS
ncbi:MAG TPA: phage tail protein [Rickettsia endosymbiont of Sericostoma sp. HW-2014]|nr:phage tail protein [Rickettsia endosymbiont of Sericostoma sp. HW-2014]